MCDCTNCQNCHIPPGSSETTTNGPVTIRQLEGRDHFVVPCTMLTEGVHTGSNGPLFYPREELDRTARLWNGKAVIVHHPSNPSDFSGSPDVFNRSRVGWVFNARMDGIKLIAELWIDVAKVQSVDERVFQAIIRGNQMNVSTGLTSGFMEGPGIHNGKQFTHTIIGIMPEHLAILPDMVGACSVDQGCGINPSGRVPVLKSNVPVLMANTMSLIPVLMASVPVLMESPNIRPNPIPIKVLKDESQPLRKRRLPRRRVWL